MFQEFGRLTPHVLSAIASAVFLILIAILLILDIVLLVSWVAWFVKGGYMEIGKRTWGRIASVFTNEPAPKKGADAKEATVTDAHSERGRIVKAFTSKPFVVRSFAWAAVFAAIGLLLHPTIVNRFLHQSNYLGVFMTIALLFGFAMAKLTEGIYVRTERPSVIQATSFHLLDSEGRLVGALSGSNGDPFILLGLPDGSGRAHLSRRGLTIFDGEGIPRAILEMTDDAPQLTLMEQGEEAVRIDYSGLHLVDTICSAGSVSLTAFEEPGIQVKDSEGNVIWKTPTPA